MAAYEYLFGGLHCVIKTEAHPSITGDAGYTAALYVVEEDGHALRPIGDSEGVLELMAGSLEGVVKRASDYLEDRLGRRSAAPEAQPEITVVRHEVQPSFNLWNVPAIEPIHKGQHVIFSVNGAKGLTQTTGTPPRMRTGTALQDIGVGSRGWIRELSRTA